jgi:hypothetical protein
MLSLANQLVARATRGAARLILADEPALWTVSVDGRIVGTMVCSDGSCRLSWFEDADPRLVTFAGPVDDDIDGLAETLGMRIGRPVHIDSQLL